MNFLEVKNMPKILIVEDEESIRSFIKVNVIRHNYTVLEAASGEEAIELANKQPDIKIALLDVMLPGIDGFAVCQQLRETYPQLGIIMLTAKGQEADKIEGLALGADDYIVKPFSPQELMARIAALLRRINLPILNDPIKLLTTGSFSLNLLEKKLYKNDTEINLTPTELAIFNLFMHNENIALSRDNILNEVWGTDYFGDIKVVDVNIRRIRKKIADNEHTYIESVWGYGYRFQGDVTDE